MKQQTQPRAEPRTRLWSSWHLWAGVSVWLVGFGALNVHSVVHSFLELGLLDAQVYRMGGRAVIDGSPVYEARYPVSSLPFTYPPFAALLFVPLAAVGWTKGAISITLLSMMAVIRVAQLLVRELTSARAASLRLGVATACVVVAMWPIRSTLEFGQVNLLIAWLVVEDLLGRGSKSRWGGALIGIAIGIKITPVVFLGMLLLSGQVRRVVIAAATAIVTVVIGVLALPSESFAYWSDALFETSRVGPVGDVTNQSLPGVLARVTGEATTVGGWAPWALGVLTLSSWLAASLWRADRRVGAIAVASIGGLLVSPISWPHHWIWLVPAVLALAVAPDGESAHLRRVRMIVIAIVVAASSFRLQTLLTEGGMRWEAPAATDWLVGNALVLSGVAVLIVFTTQVLAHRRTALGMTSAADEAPIERVSPPTVESAASSSGRRRT